MALTALILTASCGSFINSSKPIAVPAPPTSLTQPCPKLTEMPSSATQREIAILYRTDRSAAKLCAQQQAALSAWARMVVAAFAEAEARDDPNWQRYLPWRWRF